MSIGQFIVWFADSSSFKVNCSDMIQAVNIASVMFPSLRIVMCKQTA